MQLAACPLVVPFVLFFFIVIFLEISCNVVTVGSACSRTLPCIFLNQQSKFFLDNSFKNYEPEQVILHCLPKRVPKYFSNWRRNNLASFSFISSMWIVKFFSLNLMWLRFASFWGKMIFCPRCYPTVYRR